MIEDIKEPLARAVVTWVAPEMGGRSSGPPSGPVYAATSVFVHGGDAEVQPGWPAGADQLSILVQKAETLPGGAWLCKVDFLARDLAVPLVRPGAVLLIMEGPKVVATAVVTAELLTSPPGRGQVSPAPACARVAACTRVRWWYCESGAAFFRTFVEICL